jgi:GTPase SAR1 family protein|tara:strand:- start:2178 stop:2933 length:756 start_codon:yes stop_codon:yes gene_type:complete
MKIIENSLSEIPRVPMNIDNLKDLPYIPISPLPPKSFSMLICGAPGSGKTNLMMALLTSHATKKKFKPTYYFKFFDRIEFISASIATLPDNFLNKLPDEQKHNKFTDELLVEIVESMANGENENNLLVIDDCIRDITRSKNLSKIYLNRRHCTHNAEEEGHGGLSIITTSQKFSLMPLEFRNAQSDVIVFKSSNSTEINRIRDELLFDLNKDQQEDLLREAWAEPYSFLYIKVNKPLKDKYYIKFNSVQFD